MADWWWWSYLLSLVGLVSMFLAGRRHWSGWVVGLASQVLWASYAVATGQLGFLISCVAFSAVYVINLRLWLRTPEPGETRVTSA